MSAKSVVSSSKRLSRRTNSDLRRKKEHALAAEKKQLFKLKEKELKAQCKKYNVKYDRKKKNNIFDKLMEAKKKESKRKRKIQNKKQKKTKLQNKTSHSLIQSMTRDDNNISVIADISDDEIDTVDIGIFDGLNGDDNDLFNDYDEDEDGKLNDDEISTQKYHVHVPSITIPSKQFDLDSLSLYSSDSNTSYSVGSSPSVINDDSSPSVINDNSSPSDMKYDETPIITSSDTASIEFDVDCIDDGKYLMSSKGFDTGYHEWSVKILKCDTYRQDIGIVGILDKNVEIGNCGGIRDAKEFGARAIYGNIADVNAAYYASYNDDNSCECNKNIAFKGWRKGDKIKICLDLENGNITFLLNNINISNAISIQKNQTYYPLISFSGDCKYEIY